MSRVTDGLYDHEKDRWVVMGPTYEEDGQQKACEVRITRTQKYGGGVYLSHFFGDEPLGTQRRSVPLHPQHMRELIADLEDALRVIEDKDE